MSAAELSPAALQGAGPPPPPPAAPPAGWWARLLQWLRDRLTRRHLVGASRSWTIRFNAALLLASQAVPMIRAQLPDLAGWLPSHDQMRLAAVLAAVGIALRIKTRSALVDR